MMTLTTENKHDMSPNERQHTCDVIHDIIVNDIVSPLGSFNENYVNDLLAKNKVYPPRRGLFRIMINEFLWREYNNFVNLLILRLNELKIRKHPTITWESYNLTKPFYELIKQHYDKMSMFDEMYVELLHKLSTIVVNDLDDILHYSLPKKKLHSLEIQAKIMSCIANVMLDYFDYSLVLKNQLKRAEVTRDLNRIIRIVRNLLLDLGKERENND